MNVPPPTATHAVCPLCGKSSSLRTFPSGSGTDLRLQSFRGKGRGRGFEAVPDGSGLEDPKLTTAVHDKTVSILRTLEAHGYPVAVLSTKSAIAEFDSLRSRITSLEQEVDRERAYGRALEAQVKDVEAELERDRRLRLNTLGQIGKLSTQLERAEATEDRLFTASLHCVASLRQLRERLKGVPFAAQSLSPLVHDVKGVVDLIHELRTIASIRSASESGDLATR